MTRVLGVDQGSQTLGLASLEADAAGIHVRATWRIHVAGDDRHARLYRIGDELDNLAGVLRQDGLEPDVIAIESVAVGFNVVTALRMAETRGYLLATFRRILPHARATDVNLAQTKIAVGLKGNTRREVAKPATTAYILERFGLELGEDEADAVAIALAGFALLERARA